jgi:hypothetical protein
VEKHGSGPKTSTEILGELERRRREDPEYRRRVEATEAEQAERHRQDRKDEQPVLRVLAAAGLEVDTLWALYKDPAVAAKAAPILVSQLALDHPPKVLGGIASALDRTTARRHWDQLAALYEQTDNAEARDRATALLSGCATRSHYEQLLGFLAQAGLGVSRIYFLRPVHRIGNRISPGAGRAVIATFADDAVLGGEARAILAGSSRNG